MISNDTIDWPLKMLESEVSPPTSLATDTRTAQGVIYKGCRCPQHQEIYESRTTLTFPRVKWIVTSRNQPNIEARLRVDDTQMSLSLELNEEHVSRAVQVFIDFRVSKLRLIKDDGEPQDIVRVRYTLRLLEHFSGRLLF